MLLICIMYYAITFRFFYDNNDGDEFIQYKNVKVNIKC